MTFDFSEDLLVEGEAFVLRCFPLDHCANPRAWRPRREEPTSRRSSVQQGLAPVTIGLGPNLPGGDHGDTMIRRGLE